MAPRSSSKQYTRRLRSAAVSTGNTCVGVHLDSVWFENNGLLPNSTGGGAGPDIVFRASITNHRKHLNHGQVPQVVDQLS